MINQVFRLVNPPFSEPGFVYKLTQLKSQSKEISEPINQIQDKNLKDGNLVGRLFLMPINANDLYIFLKIFLMVGILLQTWKTLLMKLVFPKLFNPQSPFVLFQ